MTLGQISVLRRWTGRAGCLFCLFFFLSLLDAFFARFRDPPTHLLCMPGQSVTVTGPLGKRIGNVQELTYTGNSDRLLLLFESIQTGFWLGGYMWRGRILVDVGIAPGRYQVAVPTLNESGDKPYYMFQLEVLKDETSLRKASSSYIRRYLGMNPWKIALFFLALITPAFVGVFLLSKEADDLLAQEGKAEVYLVLEGEKGYRIYFGMGSNRNIYIGESLNVFGGEKQLLGDAAVQEVFEDYSIAQTDFLQPVIKPGFMVARFPATLSLFR